MADQKTRQGRAAAAADERRRTAEAGLPPGAGNGDGPGGEVAVRDPLRQLMDSFQPEVARQLPRLIDPDAFMRVALTGMRSSKQAAALARCTRPSLFAALLESARLGLMPFTDEAAIVPFGDQATFIPMYQGYVQLFYRTGQVARVTAQLIRKGDAWELAYGDAGGFYHKPALVDADGNPVKRGDPILAYCYVTMRDGSRTEVTTVDRWEAEDTMREHSRSWQNAEKIWRESNGKRGRDSAWHTNFADMWLKTGVRRHAKVAPKSPELVQLLMLEDRDDSRRWRDAPLPPVPPMPDVVEGVDWTRDVAGAVTGEVLRDERDERDEPGGQPGRERVTIREHAGDGTVPAGAAAAAGAAGTPAGNGGGQDAPLITAQTTGRLNWKFSQCGWSGDEYRDRRIAVAGLLGNLQGRPLPITAIAQLTDDQGKAAIAFIDEKLLPRYEGKDQRAAALQGLYDRLTEALAAEHGAAAAADITRPGDGNGDGPGDDVPPPDGPG
jgi:phage RecT family recombinase